MAKTRMIRDRMIGRRGRDGRGSYRRDSRRREYYDEPMEEEYDYRDYRERDYHNEENDFDDEYHYDLENWKKKLKRKTKTNMTDEEAINKAKTMGVKFEDYDEEEFLVTFYMLQSDFINISTPESYLIMAKQWLEDDDAELQGSDKLCAYYYAIVKGKMF